MYPKHSFIKQQQTGSALVIAIFIIVVMTLVGAALVKMINAEAQAISHEVLGTRAFQAAQSGMQRQLSTVFPLNEDPLLNPSRCIAITIEFESEPGNLLNQSDEVIPYGLMNCEVSASQCQEVADVDDIKYYSITSTGQCSAGEVTTSRTIEVQARSM